jgi:hypothetical protein
MMLDIIWFSFQDIHIASCHCGCSCHGCRIADGHRRTNLALNAFPGTASNPEGYSNTKSAGATELPILSCRCGFAGRHYCGSCALTASPAVTPAIKRQLHVLRKCESVH